MVQTKGECAHAVDSVSKFLDYLGYKKFAIKSDQEDILQWLRDAVKRERKEDLEQLGKQESKAKDSASNGSVEMPISKFKD